MSTSYQSISASSEGVSDNITLDSSEQLKGRRDQNMQRDKQKDGILKLRPRASARDEKGGEGERRGRIQDKGFKRRRWVNNRMEGRGGDIKSCSAGGVTGAGSAGDEHRLYSGKATPLV